MAQQSNETTKQKITTDEVSGTIDRFLFQNEENGFAIFVLQLNSKETVAVKGVLPGINAGEHVCLQGAWTFHKKFGKQFEAHSCTKKLPTTVVGLKKYLGSGLIKGIGKVYASKLVDAFGVETLDIINDDPWRMLNVPGIGRKRVETIIEAWQDQKEIANIMVFLQERGVSPSLATKIYKKYHQQSIALLKENPYRIAEDIWGVGFKTADQLAQQLGFEPESQKRIQAGNIFALNQAATIGHLYLEVDDLKKETCRLLELDQSQHTDKLKLALHTLYNEEKIKLVTHKERHFVGLTALYHTEKSVATRIKKLLEHQTKHSFDLDAMYQSLRVSDDNVQLNEQQQRGIMAALQHKVAVITGGPGTGKTTLIKKFLTILEKNHCRYRLAAPTGRAAKRMIEGTGRHAVTIHRLLELDPSTMQFKNNENNALKLDFLIVDEASMIDIFLANSLIKALPHTAHVVFIGDVDQLPSVGAGNFLNDLIASEQGACVRLTEIFRQARDSMIIVNAHRINRGEFPTWQLPNAKKDFIFLKEEDPTKTIDHLRRIFFGHLKKMHIPPQEATVLVPMNRGTVGTHHLNHQLQEMLNPVNTPQHVVYKGTTFKVGDRVMQIRNNYDKHVYNGDVGVIDSVNTADKNLVVEYPDKAVEYEFDELNEMVLAYALSIHKSQGSEYTAAIIPIFMQHFTLLQRNLIYTAITRAKKFCIFIGQPKAIAMAINNNKGIKRTTLLTPYLTSDLACR